MSLAEYHHVNVLERDLCKAQEQTGNRLIIERWGFHIHHEGINIESFPANTLLLPGTSFKLTLTKPDDMTPKAFIACFEVLFKLYDNLKTTFVLTIGEHKKNFHFFNVFSDEYCHMFVQQKKQNYKMTMDKFVDFFQTCHPTDQPVYKQCQCKAAVKGNARRLTKSRMLLIATNCKNTLNNNLVPCSNCVCQENYWCTCKDSVYDMLWQSCTCHNWNHLDYCKPLGSALNHL